MKTVEVFLAENNLVLVEKIAKGWSSYVYLVKGRRGKKFALKVLREKSNRRNMVLRETANLRKANSVGVGPKLIKSDSDADCVLMEFVGGVSFSDWLFSNPSKKELQKFLKSLFVQARKLDKIGLDHGQLAGKGKNILVRNGKPVIIDFEKASSQRKAHNEKVLEAFLYRNPGSAVVEKVKEIIGKK